MSLATTVPRRVSSKSIYDTSIYIRAIREAAFYADILPHFARSLPTTYFCAVVAQELKAGCQTPAATKRVDAFLRPFQRARRLVTPTFTDWEETGNLLASLLKDQPNLKDKLPRLINDTLIALCAVRLGAVVYTANEADFALVRQYKRFRLAVL